MYNSLPKKHLFETFIKFLGNIHLFLQIMLTIFVTAHWRMNELPENFREKYSTRDDVSP